MTRNGMPVVGFGDERVLPPLELRTAYTITYASNLSPSGNPRVRVRANREGASVRLSPVVNVATP